MKLADALRALMAHLYDENARFALVGGLAASARGEARFTRDVDVALSVEDDTEAERLIFGLKQRGYELLATVEQEATHRLATARLREPGGVVCDAIFATSGIEHEVVDTAEHLELFPGLYVPTATTEALLAMKTLSATPRRPRDLGDIQAMLENTPNIDRDVLRVLLGAIEQRGYARGQDLLAKWKSIEAELRGASA